MFRLDLLLAIVLVPSYIVQSSDMTQFTPEDDSTEGPLEYYNSDNSDEFIDPSRQTQDYTSALAGFYKLSEVMSHQKHAISEHNDDPMDTNGHNENNGSIDAEDSIAGSPTTTVFPNDQPTTYKSNDFTEDLSHPDNDVVLDNTSIHDSLSTNSSDVELSTHKQAKTFPSFLMDQQDQHSHQQQQSQQHKLPNDPVYQYFSENSIQPNAAYIRNDTDDFNRMENINDGDTYNIQAATLQYPMTTMITNSASTTSSSRSIPPTKVSNLEPSTFPIAAAPIVAPKMTITPTTTTISTTTATTIQNENNNPPVTLATYASKKAAKKIDTTTRVYKYSADEILRKYLEDTYIRAPLATLINTSPESLRKAKILWKSALRPNTPIDIVLVAFNSSGVGVTYTFKNTRTMMAGIDSVQESREMRNGGSGFYGIMRASELIPYDSAIFISTDSIPDDINLARYTAITLLKKRIRLYVIWFGTKTTDDNETFSNNQEGGILGEVALRSGGEIFRVTEESLGPNGDLGLITHFLQNDIQGAQVLDIPVNTTVSNLQIKIQGNIDQATITTPTGDTIIDLMDKKSIRNFSLGSYLIFGHFTNNKYIDKTDDDDNRRKIAMNFNKFNNKNEMIINLNVSAGDKKGIYTLKIIPHYNNDRTSTNFNLIVKLDYKNKMSGIKTNDNFISADNKKHRRIRRSENDIESDRDTEIAWPLYESDIPDDIDEQILTNSTEMESRSGRNTLYSVTRIELGVQSQLLVNPGATAQIYYEITNLRDDPTFHNFQVVDEQRFLRSLNPPSMWLAPGQTSTAIVTCIIPSNAEIGTKDKITFSSQGLSVAMQAAIMTITAQASAVQDRRPPLIYWNYGSRCEGRTGAGHCAGSVWSLELTTIDTDTGILRIQSNPKGIIIRNAFTAGTTNEVKATYTASCCSTRVTITSYDLAGNQKTISVDVTEYYLNWVEILAITLGSILLILIIAIIIALLVYCCKKRQKARELPVYRSRTSRIEVERTT